MAVMPPGDHPTDLYLLLGRIDGKVDGIAGTLAAMNTRADNHEQRINNLENENSLRKAYVPRFEKVETEVEEISREITATKARATGWLEMGHATKALIGLLIAVVGYFGYKVEFAPEVKSTTVIEQSVSSK